VVASWHASSHPPEAVHTCAARGTALINGPQRQTRYWLRTDSEEAARRISEGRGRLSRATCCRSAKISSEVDMRLRKKTQVAVRNTGIKIEHESTVVTPGNTYTAPLRTHSDVLVIVKSETVVGWHRAFACTGAGESHPQGGRPNLGEEIPTIIGRIATENSDGRATKIRGELPKLGFEVSDRTVARYLQHMRRRAAFSLNAGCLPPGTLVSSVRHEPLMVGVASVKQIFDRGEPLHLFQSSTDFSARA